MNELIIQPPSSIFGRNLCHKSAKKSRNLKRAVLSKKSKILIKTKLTVSKSCLYVLFRLGQNSLSGQKKVLSWKKSILSGQMDKAFVSFLSGCHKGKVISLRKNLFVRLKCFLKLLLRIFFIIHYVTFYVRFIWVNIGNL